jgi:hypothetical protein
VSSREGSEVGDVDGDPRRGSNLDHVRHAAEPPRRLAAPQGHDCDVVGPRLRLVQEQAQADAP